MPYFILSSYSSWVLGFLIRTSNVPFRTVNGVLNSCDASEVNCFSRSTAFSMRSNKSLMVLESTYNSSLFCGKSIRSFRLSFVILLEVSVIRVTGFMLLPAISRAIKKRTNNINGNAIKNVSCKFSKIIVASSKDIAINKNPITLFLSKRGT